MSQFTHVFSWIMVRVASALLVSCLLFTSACSTQSDTQEDMTSIVSVTTLAHPPGTFLRDTRGEFWMVDRWPYRLHVTSQQIESAHLRAEDAIQMRATEEVCLLAEDRDWFAFMGDWMRLCRSSDNRLWYVNQSLFVRYEVSDAVVRAWHDDPAVATPCDDLFGADVFERGFRPHGRMPLPDGALIRTEHELVLFNHGVFHAFANNAFAVSVGYRPDRATRMSEVELESYGDRRSALTMFAFQTCPATARVTWINDNDRDDDGVERSLDCDDDDSRRAPGHVELCDNVDNDCDNVVDEGFPIGATCVADDACDLRGAYQCAFDAWSVECVNEDASCP